MVRNNHVSNGLFLLPKPPQGLPSSKTSRSKKVLVNMKVNGEHYSLIRTDLEDAKFLSRSTITFELMED